MTNLPKKPPQIDVSTEVDLIVLRLNGEYTIDVASYIHALSDTVSNEHGYRLHLVDVRNAGSITPEARRFILADRQRSAVRGSISIVGANFAVRTLAHMVIRALGLLTKVSIGVDFFQSETDARAWLDIERTRLKSEAGSSKAR